MLNPLYKIGCVILLILSGYLFFQNVVLEKRISGYVTKAADTQIELSRTIILLSEKLTEAVNKPAIEYEVVKYDEKVRIEYVTKEVDRVVKDVEFINICISDNGLQLYKELVTRPTVSGTATLTSEPVS